MKEKQSLSTHATCIAGEEGGDSSHLESINLVTVVRLDDDAHGGAGITDQRIVKILSFFTIT
jgi:hypothetical protein